MVSLEPRTGPLGLKLSAHLLRRATFGATRKQIDDFANMTAAQAVAELLQAPEEKAPPPIDPLTGSPWIDPENSVFTAGEGNSGEDELKDVVLGWWLSQMAKSGMSLSEKMAYFLHTHIPLIQSRIQKSAALYYHIELLRFYGLGNFKEFSLKLCLDNAMLRHLDGYLNVVGRPQENYAREFMELYTIGKGPQVSSDDYTNYTELDVQEGAKILSGYGEDTSFRNIDEDTGLAAGVIQGGEWQGDVYVVTSAKKHDESTKTLSERFQNTVIEPAEIVNGKATAEAALGELQQFVDVIFDQEETAKHICRKLYRFFVYYKIDEEVETGIIAPLAETFRDNDYDFVPVLSQLLQSQHFYDVDNAELKDNKIGAIIKSPIELVMGMIKFFQVELPDDQLDYATLLDGGYSNIMKYMSEQGMSFVEPYEVAGYPAYHQFPVFNRNWISANYLAQRYKFIEHLLKKSEDDPNSPLLDIVAYVKDTNNISDPFDPDKLVAELVDYLLPEGVSDERFTYFVNAVLLDNLSVINWQSEWQQYLDSGDDVAVRGQLENLLKAILQSPESQLQ
ncbi:DUF1800 family protein [Flammeovirgaceae bacterium SG7u.111]|nr:DUF1800 family protein [Flammeovirgaceae bacterium SG7u.132]WPO37628.1 DUF1800 family protein [Flammeovirgaceae bacterium SG7u.111]